MTLRLLASWALVTALQLPAFRAETRLVVVHATVRNERGELVTNASNVGIAVFVLAGAGDLVGAATLGGATEGVDLSERVLSPEHRQRYDAAVTQVAQRLGPALYTEARERGAAMSYDEIIQFTLSQLALASGSA